MPHVEEIQDHNLKISCKGIWCKVGYAMSNWKTLMPKYAENVEHQSE